MILMCRLSRSFSFVDSLTKKYHEGFVKFSSITYSKYSNFLSNENFSKHSQSIDFSLWSKQTNDCLLITIFPFLTGFDQIEMTIWSDGFDCINFISHRFLIEKLLLLDQMHNLQRVIWNGIENINRIYFSLITSNTMFNIQGKFNNHLVFLKLRSSLERDRRIILSWIILEIHRVRSRGTLFGQHQKLMESKCETKFRAGCNSAWRGREENTH